MFVAAGRTNEGATIGRDEVVWSLGSRARGGLAFCAAFYMAYWKEISIGLFRATREILGSFTRSDQLRVSAEVRDLGQEHDVRRTLDHRLVVNLEHLHISADRHVLMANDRDGSVLDIGLAVEGSKRQNVGSSTSDGRPGRQNVRDAEHRVNLVHGLG